MSIEFPEENGILCTCSAEGHRHVTGIRLEAARLLEVPLKDLTPTLMASLTGDFGAEIDCGADMWFGVSIKRGEHTGFYQCDLPLDGYLWGWFMLREAFPEVVTRKGPGFDPSCVEVVESLLKQGEDLEKTEEEHRASCSECSDEPYNRCGILKNMDLSNKVMDVYDRELGLWGIPDAEDKKWWGTEWMEDGNDGN